MAADLRGAMPISAVVLLAVAALILGALVLIRAVDAVGVSPRRLAPYLERRAEGHNRLIVGAAGLAARMLVATDRGPVEIQRPLPVPSTLTGEPELNTGIGHARRLVLVASADDARRAIDRAEPGDVITFVPGTYRFHGSYVDVRRPGAADAPIVVRAERAGSVVLEFDMVEGFLVSAPYWTFERLVIRGACADDTSCEHAFHVVAGASHFVARENEVVDFNAQFKINASDGTIPDSGIITGNFIHDTRARQTANPVTKIDLVAASHWRIVGNRIADFVKAQGNGISVGAFAKGGGADNRFLRNVVVCEHRLVGLPGQRVGLSLGDGGTGAAYCRDRRCITEQDASVIEANLIASCSDDGIYLNSAAQSRIVANTLVDTAGILLRFGTTSAEVTGNLVDGPIIAKQGAALHARDNRDTSLAQIYAGRHPVRRLFLDAPALDFAWRGAPLRREHAARPIADLCGVQRPASPTYGAFEDINRCVAQR